MYTTIQFYGSDMPFINDEFASVKTDAMDNEKLRALNTNLETLAYALSHDLRAPLRAIEGFAQAMSEDVAVTRSDSAIYSLQEIRSGVDRMQEMISKWLSFIRSDNYFLHRERINLSELAQSVVAELRVADARRMINVIISPDLFVSGDRVLLRELLQNLIGNSWKFTKKKGDGATIELGVSNKNGMSTYFVRDNGVGMSAVNAQQAFEPFIRLHDTGSFDGTGIGLTIVRRIVEAHGGTVWAEGQRGMGPSSNSHYPIPIFVMHRVTRWRCSRINDQ